MLPIFHLPSGANHLLRSRRAQAELPTVQRAPCHPVLRLEQVVHLQLPRHHPHQSSVTRKLRSCKLYELHWFTSLPWDKSLRNFSHRKPVVVRMSVMKCSTRLGRNITSIKQNGILPTRATRSLTCGRFHTPANLNGSSPSTVPLLRSIVCEFLEKNIYGRCYCRKTSEAKERSYLNSICTQDRSQRVLLRGSTYRQLMTLRKEDMKDMKLEMIATRKIG